MFHKSLRQFTLPIYKDKLHNIDRGAISGNNDLTSYIFAFMPITTCNLWCIQNTVAKVFSGNFEWLASIQQTKVSSWDHCLALAFFKWPYYSQRRGTEGKFLGKSLRNHYINCDYELLSRNKILRYFYMFYTNVPYLIISSMTCTSICADRSTRYALTFVHRKYQMVW